MFTNLTF
jgi:hypothetical protein